MLYKNIQQQLVDLRKAFDTHDHMIVFTKLEYYGIRGVVVKWVVSLAQIDKWRSNYWINICLGQCKVQKCDVSKILKCILFADDTNVVGLSGESLHQLLETITSQFVNWNNDLIYINGEYIWVKHQLYDFGNEKYK